MIKNSGEAVSPVIGVMLMLAITIIVAATLSAFIGGASANYEAPPQAGLDVHCDGEGNDFNIIFEHRSGPYIQTKDLKITTWIENENNIVKHEQSVKSPRSTNTTKAVRTPYIYDSQNNIAPKQEFGEAIWKPGSIAGTENKAATAEFLGLLETELDELIAANTPVEVNIVHIPSGNTLLRTEFMLG